jgi:hypothetical protein
VTLEAGPAVLYDALAVPGGKRAIEALGNVGHALEFIKDQFRHCKPILGLGEGKALIENAGVPARLESGEPDPGLLLPEEGDAKTARCPTSSRRSQSTATSSGSSIRPACDQGLAMAHATSNGFIKQANGCLLVEPGLSPDTEVQAIFRDLAVYCIEKQIRRVLVKPGDDDYVGERALRVALTTMILAGLPAEFRLALVAESARIATRYHYTERDLCTAGVDAKMFDSEAGATRWLEEQRPAGPRANRPSARSSGSRPDRARRT